LPPGGSSTVHIYTQTIYRTTQSTQTIHRTTQFTNQEACGPCPIFARYNLAFALQLKKKHGKTLVRVVGERQLARLLIVCEFDWLNTRKYCNFLLLLTVRSWVKSKSKEAWIGTSTVPQRRNTQRTSTYGKHKVT